MAKFIAQRLVETIPVVILASLLVFAILHLIPGDPVDAMLGSAAAGIGTPEQRAQIEAQINAELGLSDPLPIQYLHWAGNALRGDLGQSYIRHQPVAQLIAERLPSTLELAGAALLLSVILGVGLGILAALKRNTPIDGLVMIVSLGGVSIPSFAFALLLILVFSVFLGLLPATGSGSFDRLILPAVVLGYEGVGLIARLTRASLLEVMGLEYIRTARAKGLAGRTIVLRHAMRNALIPITTQLALDIGAIAAGLIITEQVFQWPGMGPLFIRAIDTGDFPLALAWVMVVVFSVIMFNLIADIMYAVLDPRIRYA